MEQVFKVSTIDQNSEDTLEKELTSLVQIQNELKDINHTFNETIDEHGKNLEIGFEFLAPETNENIEGKIIFFRIDDRFFYKLGKNTLLEDCDEILEKLKQFKNLELYI